MDDDMSPRRSAEVGELACDDVPGDACVGDKSPVEMNDNEEVLIKGGVLFCCDVDEVPNCALDSDIRR